MTFWLAYKMLLGNKKRAFFPLLGVVCGIISLIMTLSLGAGGKEIINNSLSAIGDNRIMIGGSDFSKRDIDILENYPFVEYAIFPNARTTSENNIYIGYSKKAFSILGLNIPREREVVVDKNQFPNKKIGDIINLPVGNYNEQFKIVDIYEEKNPLELMKQGNRILMTQESYQNLFRKNYFGEIIISFDKDEDSEEYIPIILNKFKQDRGSYGEIKLLETPEVYKRVIKIQKMVSTTLGILTILSLAIGGFGIMNLIASNVKSRTGHMGILRAMGMSSKNMSIMFITEGIIVSLVGTVLGSILGVIFSILVGKIIKIYPVFSLGDIFLSLIISLVIGILMGSYPAIKGGKKDTIELLREV